MWGCSKPSCSAVNDVKLPDPPHRVETNNHCTKFHSYVLVPEDYLYRKMRFSDQPAMPQEVSHIKPGIKYGDFGQITGVTCKPKLKEVQSAWHFNLGLMRNSCSLQTWIFGSEDAENKMHSFMTKATARIPLTYFCIPNQLQPHRRKVTTSSRFWW